MNDRKLAFLYTPALDGLSYPLDCPFKTRRAGLTRSRLASLGLLGGPSQGEVRPAKASRADLERFHTSRYLDELERASSGELRVDGLHMGLGGPDTPVFKDLLEYGAWACGAGLTGADLLLAGKADIAFNLLGGFHHAGAERAGGFCYVNDVVLAAARLADGGKRVACIDLDAHHGDGTQAAFYDRDDVLTVSMHESGRTLYPWGGFEDELGSGRGYGFNVNIPVPAETYDAAYLDAFHRLVLPLVQAYAPDALVLELGMDILAGDPLTHLRMTNNVVVDVLTRLLELNRPMLVAGGGGYHVENTVRGWSLAWRTCANDGDHDALSLGLGGVMLESCVWAGGLRDRQLPVAPEQRAEVEPAIQAVVESITRRDFPHHGLARSCVESPVGES
jgi:acetoin utilization protein AcuC